MSLLASVSSNLKFWEFKDDILHLNSTCEFYEPERSISATNDILAVAWNHNQQVVAVGGTTQKLHLVQGSTGQTLSSLPIDEKDSFVGDIRALSFSHNSRYLASSIDKDVIIWDLKKRNIKTRLSGHRAIVKSLQYNKEGSIFSGDTSGAVVVWNSDQNSRSKELLNPGYRSPVNCLKLSPSNQRLVCCGYGDGSVTVWDVESLTTINRCTKAHDDSVTSLAFSPKNDRLIVTGSKDGMLNLVDLGSKHEKYSPAVSLTIGEPVSTVSFHDSALYTAVGTQNGFIQVYDWRNSRKPIVQLSAHHPLPVYELAFQQAPPARGNSRKISAHSSVTSAASSAKTLPTVSSIPVGELSASLPPIPPSTAVSHQDPIQEASSYNRSNSSPKSQFNPDQPSSIKSIQVNQPTPDINKTPNRTISPVSGLHSKEEANMGNAASKYDRSDDDFNNTSRTNGSTILTPTIAHSTNRTSTCDDDESLESHIRHQMRPVTYQQLTDALQLIQYDVHREVQAVIREQIRQFSIAKEETGVMIAELSERLQDLLQANKELRAENERLRRIY